MLAANGYAVNVDRYGHDETRLCLAAAAAVAGRSGPALMVAREERTAAASTATTARSALHHARLDAFPLGTPVLEPDLDLHSAVFHLNVSCNDSKKRQKSLFLNFEKCLKTHKNVRTVSETNLLCYMQSLAVQVNNYTGVRRWLPCHALEGATTAILNSTFIVLITQRSNEVVNSNAWD